MEIKPDDADAWYNKGNIFSNLRNFDEAIKCYDKALEIKPDYANALKNKQSALKDLEKSKYKKGFFSRFQNKYK